MSSSGGKATIAPASDFVSTFRSDRVGAPISFPGRVGQRFNVSRRSRLRPRPELDRALRLDDPPTPPVEASLRSRRAAWRATLGTPRLDGPGARWVAPQLDRSRR